MKVVVIGGTGLIGSQLVGKLDAHGHDAVAAAPSTGVNTLTGEGLAEVLEGASVVVDVSNSPSFEDEAVMDFFRASTANLLKAEADARVQHHVALSVVGTERLRGSGYFRAKQAQEELIKASGMPYSIVHATQFFEFAKGLADGVTDGRHRASARREDPAHRLRRRGRGRRPHRGRLPGQRRGGGRGPGDVRARGVHPHGTRRQERHPQDRH
jgi:hypothetical protein